MIRAIFLPLLLANWIGVGLVTSHADVRSGENVTVAADETVDDDLYVFGDTITVDGTINGDLIAFGRQVVINGTIQGDVASAAQTIILNGKVSDDVRIAGQVLTLQSQARVGDDLIAAGFSLECASDSRIAGDVNFAGYQAVFAGDIENKLDSATANCQLKGQIGGNVDLSVDGGGAPPPTWFIQSPMPIVPAGLTITETAHIRGDLEYKSLQKATVDPMAKIDGSIDFQQVSQNSVAQTPSPTVVSRVIAALKQFLALFIVGLVVVYACPSWTGRLVETIQQRPLACLGWGLLSIVGVVATVFLLLFATIVIAILLGLASLESLLPAWLATGTLATAGLGIGFAVFAVWVAKVVVGVWAGNRIVSGKHWNPGRRLLSLPIGMLLFVALVMVPYVGGFIGLAVALIGIGAAAIWLFGTSNSKTVKAKPIPAQH